MSSWEDADVARGERAARQLLVDLKINHPVEVDIDTLAYMRGALVRDTPMTGAQGRSCRIGDRAIISVNDQVTYMPRRRYVVAHELGHLEIHRDRNQLSRVTRCRSANAMIRVLSGRRTPLLVPC